MNTPENSTGVARGAAGPPLVFALAAIFALGPFSMDTYLPALPAMGKALGTSTGIAQLTIPVFMAGMGAGQLVFGPLSDRYGRRRPLLAGLALYLLASIGCALADNAWQLIVCRLLQGLGVCAGQAITMALLADLYEPADMARYTSRLVLISGVAPLIAPMIGGALLGAFGWQAIFWSLAAYGAVVLAISAWRVPETRSDELQQHARGESSWHAYGQVLRNSVLLRFALVGALGMGAFATYLANAASVLIEDFGIPPQRFGLYFAINVAGLMAGNQLNRTLLVRHRTGALLRWAVLYLAAMTLLLTLVARFIGAHHALVLGALCLALAAVPPLLTNAMALAQGQDRRRAGAVAAVLGVLQSTAAVVAAGVSSLANDGTPVPMALTMFVCAAGAALLFRSLPRNQQLAG